MPKISTDNSVLNAIRNLHSRETLNVTANIAALNGVAQVVADGCSTVMLNVLGAYVGTLVVEGSIDGVNWYAIPVKQLINSGTAPVYLLVLASAQIGQFVGSCAGANFVRARMSAWTSGTAIVILSADIGNSEIVVSKRGSDQHATITAATGVAATLTIPAVTGMLHHFTRILIERHTSVLLTAGATPTIITTTNLAGARAFSIPADAAAQGQVYREVLEPTVPLKSTSYGVATTFVAPLTTGVIWRMSADYYLAP
jgi:hypothetical protein